MSSLPTPKIEITTDTAAFWEASTAGRLHLPRCNGCGLVIWYPRPVCPDCHGTDLTWFDSTGLGSVYSFTVVRKGQGAWAEHAPYVVAFVELDDGPRIATNIVDCDPDTVTVGMPVRVVFDAAGDSAAVPRFAPLS